MLIAYLCTRRGRTALVKGLLGVLAFSYGGLISSAALDAIRLQADTLFIEAQFAPADAQPLYFQGESVIPADGSGVPPVQIEAARPALLNAQAVAITP